jgi:NitT/TauT family transport system substrate-binding protein
MSRTLGERSQSDSWSRREFIRRGGLSLGAAAFLGTSIEALLVACGGQTAAPAAPGQLSVRVLAATHIWPFFLSAMLGQAQGGGQFKDAGLNVFWEPSTATPASVAMAAVIAGSTDVACISSSGIIAAAAHGLPAKVFAAETLGYYAGIFIQKSKADALAQRGVTPTSPLADRLRALKGLHIWGSSAGGPIWILWRIPLKDVGLNPDSDVIFDFILPPAQIAAFVGGRLDVIMSTDPITNQQLGANAVVWATPDEMKTYWGKGYYQVWCTSDQFANQNPDVLKRIVGALQKMTAIYKDPTQRSKMLTAAATLFPTVNAANLATQYDFEVLSETDPTVKTADLQDTIDLYNAGAGGKPVSLKPADLTPNGFLGA